MRKTSGCPYDLASNMKDVWVDVGATAALIMLFQVTFFFMGQNWEYPESHDLLGAVFHGYKEAALQGGDEVRSDNRLKTLLFSAS